METVLLVLNSLGLGGLGVFIYLTFRGLRTQVKTLQDTIEEQQRTLQAARERAEESNRLRKSYMQALSDFQDLGDKIQERQKKVIGELEDANEKKDEELAKLKKSELEQIELAQKTWNRIPELIEKVDELLEDVGSQTRLLAEAIQSANIVPYRTTFPSQPFQIAALLEVFRIDDSSRRSPYGIPWLSEDSLPSLIWGFSPAGNEQNETEADERDETANRREKNEQ